MKYILIQFYPGSPVLDTIINSDEQGKYFWDDKEIKNPELYPTFWKPLGFDIDTVIVDNVTGTLYTKKENGWFVEQQKNIKEKFIGDGKRYSIVKKDAGKTSSENWQVLDTRFGAVYKVRRLSDGLIFKVGDYIDYEHRKNLLITSITVSLSQPNKLIINHTFSIEFDLITKT